MAAVASKSPDSVDLYAQLSAGRDDNKDESFPGGQDLMRGKTLVCIPSSGEGQKYGSHRYARRYVQP